MAQSVNAFRRKAVVGILEQRHDHLEHIDHGLVTGEALLIIPFDDALLEPLADLLPQEVPA